MYVDPERLLSFHEYLERSWRSDDRALAVKTQVVRRFLVVVLTVQKHFENLSTFRQYFNVPTSEKHFNMSKTF